jgi:hypothetical protein
MRFNALKAQALKRGWTEHVKKERSSAFSEIPPAAGTKVKKSAAA